MSEFIVSARKYRPRAFDEVVGQGHVSETLRNALKTNQIAHAFLFTGPRGVGKTTMARILGQVLNCENPSENIEACNECSSCKSFNESASFNIIELDAASNNSVEHIRALIDQVRFPPQQGKYKVFIIDEVHMLSSQAFNAFLKTLEEPPPYAIFILATTEKHKILPTILSRCQIFDFKQIQVQDIVGHLQKITKSEGIEADTDALNMIAQKADGALRDALSIFDRIAIASNGHITYDIVIENLNILDYDYYFQIVESALTEDVANNLLIFNKIVRQGFEPGIFLNGLSAHLRNLLVSKNPKTVGLLNVGDKLTKRYGEQANSAPLSFVLTALNIINAADTNYKMARNKRLHVELALIKLTYIRQAVNLSQMPSEKKKSNPPVKKELEKSPQVQESPKVASTPNVVVEPAVAYEKPPTNTENASPAPAPKESIKPSAAVVGLSLGAFEAKAEEELAEAKAKKPLLNDEVLAAAWKEYIELVESASVRQVLIQSIARLEQKTIIVRHSGDYAEQTIKQERGLMEYLRKRMQYDRLTLEYEYDQTLAPKKDNKLKKKILTRKEKYDILYTENPHIETFIKMFSLHLED